jgi:hypothetical protein
MIPGYTKESFIKLAGKTNTDKPAYVRTRPKGVTLRHMPSVDQMYDAYEYAETGTIVPKGQQYWKRTQHAPKGGSAAFGPVQTTRKLVLDAFKFHPSFKERYSAWYNKDMGPMQANFLKHGRNKGMVGYDANYDYGGHGYWNQKNNDMYKKMNLDLIRLTMLDADKKLVNIPKNQRTVDQRINQHINVWRGKPISADPTYYDKVLDNLYDNHPGLFSDFDESSIHPKTMEYRNKVLNNAANSWIYK